MVQAFGDVKFGDMGFGDVLRSMKVEEDDHRAMSCSKQRWPKPAALRVRVFHCSLGSLQRLLAIDSSISPSSHILSLTSPRSFFSCSLFRNRFFFGIFLPSFAHSLIPSFVLGDVRVIASPECIRSFLTENCGQFEGLEYTNIGG